MKSSLRSRTPSKLSDSVHHQLNMYALAASAAGVGLLALAQPAYAKIVYTKTHRVIGPNQHYDLDFNRDKITDFRLSNNTGCTDLCGEILGLSAPVGNGAVGYQTGGGEQIANALKMGSRIGASGHFESRGAAMCGFNSLGDGGGPWCYVANRYLGLQFKIKGVTHYGWARLSVTGVYQTMKATLTGYAYETIPNKPVIAGKAKGPDVITVQPASPGRLAQGSAGLAVWRQKESTIGAH